MIALIILGVFPRPIVHSRLAVGEGILRARIVHTTRP
jgi:hypothetical protein